MGSHSSKRGGNNYFSLPDHTPVIFRWLQRELFVFCFLCIAFWCLWVWLKYRWNWLVAVNEPWYRLWWCCCHDKVIARLRPFHLMNAEPYQVGANPQSIRLGQSLWVCLWAAIIHTHYCHVVLLGTKADAHFNIPWSTEVCMQYHAWSLKLCSSQYNFKTFGDEQPVTLTRVGPAEILPPNSLPPNMAATNLCWSEVPLHCWDCLVVTYLWNSPEELR